MFEWKQLKTQSSVLFLLWSNSWKLTWCYWRELTYLQYSVNPSAFPGFSYFILYNFLVAFQISLNKQCSCSSFHAMQCIAVMTHVGPSLEQNPIAWSWLAVLLPFHTALHDQEFIAVQPWKLISYPASDSSLEWKTRCFPVLKMKLILLYVLTHLLL